MIEHRLFDKGAVPEWTTPGWYAGRESAPHLEQNGHNQRLTLSAMYAMRAVTQYHAASIVDLGAGDGGLLSICPNVPRWGYDLQQTNVDAAARRGVNVSYLDVVQDADAVLWADCVIVTEMLEHLIDPHALVRKAATSGAKILIASSPYTETKHAHYEFHTWAWDREGYEKMITDAGWHVVDSATAWICQVVLAVIL